MEQYLLEMNNIHKSFPGVYVLKGVHLDLKKGEVLALVGENGAGKSTVINILGGIHQMDEGEIIIEGKHAKIDSVLSARTYGVSIIHQELVLVPHLTVAENIFINREPKKHGLIDKKAMFERAQKFIDDLGLTLDARAKVSTLTIAQQQMVEIVKAISFHSKIIVMDEPTSSLSDREIEALFSNIRMLKEKGIGIIYISHRLSELEQIADRVTIFRDGESVYTGDADKTSNDEIVRMMVGREVVNYYTRTYNQPGDPILRVEHLSSEKVRDISFDVKAGEIVGFAGLVGAGRTETIKALLGFDQKLSGEVWMNNEPITIKNPADAYAHSIGYIPESRREESLFGLQSVQFNLTLEILKDFIHGIRVNKRKESAITEEYIQKLSIKTPTHQTYIQNLSGGNQQKVVISRWLAANPMILIMDEPTRGIDVGAKAEIYELMNDLAKAGMGIIMISSELPEIINMSDRVVVMREGQISRILPKELLSQEEIMKYAVNV